MPWILSERPQAVHPLALLELDKQNARQVPRPLALFELDTQGTKYAARPLDLLELDILGDKLENEMVSVGLLRTKRC